MRRLLLLDVSSSAVAASLCDRRSTTAIGQRPHTGSSDLVAAIDTLLAAVPARQRGRRVRVRLDFPFAQVKRVDRLPPVSPKVATQIVRANRDTYFLRASGEHVVPDVWRDPNGVLWAAAFDDTIVHNIAAAVRANRWRIDWFEPSRELLSDASVDHPEVLAWRSVAVAARRATRRIEYTTTGVLTIIAVAGVVLAPGIHARHERGRLAGEVQRSGAARDEAARARAELASITASLNTIQAFRRQRRASTALFVAIGTALPDSTAITTLHIDSAEASFVAVSPHVVDLLEPVSEALPGRDLRIASAVTREQLAAARVERATFRARRQGETRAGSPPVHDTAVR